MEQLIDTLPSHVRVWVKERKPKSSTEAGKFADDYFQARGEHHSQPERKPENRPQIICHGCGRAGHKVKECLAAIGTGNGKKKDVECYNCHLKGHFSSRCPHKALYCGDLVNQRVTKKGTVEGRWVEDILLDTGCSHTLVHQELVPEEAFLRLKATTICCAHGDTVVYPLARVHIEVQGYSIDVEAAVSEGLPVGVLLGTDVSQLSELLSLPGERAMIMTRAQRQQLARQEKEENLKREECGVQPRPVNTDIIPELPEESLWLSELHEDLFEPPRARDKPRLSRATKRMNRRRYNGTPTEHHVAGVDTEKLKYLQLTSFIGVCQRGGS